MKAFFDYLKKDEALYGAYKDNIAMAFVDATHQYRKKHGKTFLTTQDISKIANTAADNFLKLMLK